MDISNDQENEMRRKISNEMPEEAVKEIYNRQADAMREQLDVASTSMGMNAPVEIIGRPDSKQVAQPVRVSNRK